MRTAFAGLGEENRRRLEAASDLRALADLFGSVLDGTRQIHFRVRTLFRKADDDDADDDYDPPDTLDVMTPFGDCGNDFQVGETYLVYANVSLAVFLTGCSKTADHGAGKSPSAAAYFKVDAATAGTISGSILYLGSRPARRAIDVSGDPACEAANHDAPRSCRHNFRRPGDGPFRGRRPRMRANFAFAYIPPDDRADPSDPSRNRSIGFVPRRPR